MSVVPGEITYRMCKRCHAFVSASLDDKCGCARAEHVLFNESQMRCGIQACSCGYVGTVSHGCKDGCSRLVAKIATYVVHLRPCARCDDAHVVPESGEARKMREHGQPSAVAVARGVAPMLCVDDPCGDDVAEEA